MSDDNFQKIFAKNLTDTLEKRKLTKADLGRAVGVSKATASSWCLGKKMPRPDKIDKICQYLGVSRIDLVTDHSSVLHAMASDNTVLINVYGSIPAGIPLEAIEVIDDQIAIPAAWTTGGREYMGFRVKGDSMSPKYLDGDILVVLIQSNCESGQDAVVYVNGYDAVLKKVVKRDNCIILQPINPAYEPRFFYLDDPTAETVEILGVVVECRRKVL
ncbi:MAG: XRE family transcriptional regulator [Eubacteriaceae bacterium]|nr:XRE family transcriptional regulator [Eubacteriaceae bacterium]